MRGSGIESCGLRHLLNYDGTLHWHGSASNVSGPALRAMNNLVFTAQSGVHLLMSLSMRVLDEDNLTHVPMSLRARTSAPDLWLAVIKCL